MIVHVDMNAFYPSCEQLVNPDLLGKPVIVVMTPEEGGKITRGAVASCSYEARQFGVRSGMSYSRALQLCPHGIYKRTNFELYERISSEVMNTLAAYADILEQASIDEAYLDSTKKAEGFESMEDLGKSIKAAVKNKVGLVSSVGIAPTKASAKMASDAKKPDGLTVWAPDKLVSILAALEVSRVAGIGPKTQKALSEMHITTLGELAATSVFKLVDRFGKTGLWMWKVANGEDDERVTGNSEYKSISTEHTLDQETQDARIIKSAISKMVPELYLRLGELGLSYRTVGIKVVYSDFKVVTRDTSFNNPKIDHESIVSGVDALLDRIDYHLPIRKVGLRLSSLSERGPRQTRIEDWL